MSESSQPKLSIIIPCFNEGKTIREVIDRVLKSDIAGVEREIIVIDDGSKDDTRLVLEGIPGVKKIFHEYNKGKGAALKTGFRAANGDILLIQDADMEYDPKDHPAIIAPILAGQADFVIGSRFKLEPPHFFFGKRRSPFFTHYIGNKMIVGLSNLLFWRNDITDYEGAYKAFRKSAIESLKIEADGFEFDNEIVCKLIRLGHPLVEVPISYYPRSYQDGKKINWIDGIKMLWTIIKWRFKRI